MSLSKSMFQLALGSESRSNYFRFNSMPYSAINNYFVAPISHMWVN